jgi:hypothetical protein
MTPTPTATPTPAGHLVVTPNFLFFDAAPHSTQRESVTIRNTGSGPLQVTVGAPRHNPPFSIVSGGGTFTLSAGASKTVVVQYAPVRQGFDIDDIAITSNDPTQGPIDVTLIGISFRFF